MDFYRSLILIILALMISTDMTAQEEDSNEYIEEVVTATARETTVLDVPYNISTLSGDEITNRAILDNGELLRNFVGISTIDRGYRNAGTTNNIRIRGLNVDSSALQDYPVSAVASVSTYVDKTPIFANFLLRDLKRVEVLRGPQGTLYGSGALGGTIRYITNDPMLGISEGSVLYTTTAANGSESIGNAIDVVYNMPLGDKAAYRLVASYLDYPGVTDYVNVFRTGNLPDVGAGPSYGVPGPSNGAGFPDFYTSPPAIYTAEDADTVEIAFMRHKFLFDITNNLDLVFSAASQDDDVGGRRQASTGTRYVLNDDCVSLFAAGCYSESTYGEYENGALMLEPSSRDVSMYSLELTYEGDGYTAILSQSSHEKTGNNTTDNTGYFAGLGTFTSPIAGYFNDFYGVGGIFGTPARPYAVAERQYTNEADTTEFKIVSDIGEKFDFVVGTFMQEEDQHRAQQTYIKGSNMWNYYYWGVDYVVDANEQDFDYMVSEAITNSATYGELTYHSSENFDITLGWRRFSVEADANMNMSFKLYGSGTATDESSNKDSGTLKKVNFSYKMGDSQSYFFTISEGFRRGGVNAVATAGTFIEEESWVPFKSDTVRNVELGVKGVLDDGTFYNVSYYSVDWTDPQLNTATPTYGYYAVINGESAQTDGFDVEVSGSKGALDWDLGYAYNNSRLTADLYTPASTPTLYASSGATLPGSPEHTFNLNLAHTSYPEIIPGVGLVSRLDYYAQSSTRNYIGENSLYDATFDGFDIVNLSATAFKDDFYVSLFVKNVKNERGVTGAFLNPAFGPQPSQGFYGSNAREFFALPRTIGVAISKSF